MSGAPTKRGGGKWSPRTPAERRTAHVEKMGEKAERRAKLHRELNAPDRLESLRRASTSLAGHGHQHTREIARRLRHAK